MDSTTRLYWKCQVIGWAGFTLYVLTAYVASAGLSQVQASSVVSIVFFDFVVAPIVSDGLRRWMQRRGWIQLSVARLMPRLVVAVPLAAASLTGLVLLAEVAMNGRQRLPTEAVLGIFSGFSSALAGWLVIYFQVLARRRQSALERKALELSIVARDAQLRALRSQLNPHFLFNSLNSLRGLIAEDPVRAVSMVTGFAGLMRYSLGSDRRDTVTLADEIEAVGDYLDLERVRFEERLRVEWVIAPGAREVRLPPMMVQTLVENAVTHGISHVPDGGVVRIEAAVVGGQLRVDVSNTGSLAAGRGGAGVGLGNVRERLRLLYGDAASLTLGQRDGQTVIASLVIPCAEVGP